MNKHIELLAPGGDIDCIKAAIAAGADAVYFGLDKFNARNRAANISFDDLNGILRLAHKNKCQVFITLNIIIVDSEIPALVSILNKLVNTSIDGIIVQDLGLLYLIANYFKSLNIHASTQMTTHNEGQIEFLHKLLVERVNLSRELSLSEIEHLSNIAHENRMLIEVFVHGSNCICFSGICYMSSVSSGNSGNRGRCSQPCRDPYLITPAGKNFPLNLKDNSAYLDLKELANAGVDSIKIEGRIKKFHYVYTVVDAWRKQLQHFYNTHESLYDNSTLYSVFNRDFSDDYLTGTITPNMFIDNPRDHSAIHLSELDGHSNVSLEKAKGDVYDDRTGMIRKVEKLLIPLSTAKAPLIVQLSGEIGVPLKVSVKTPDFSFELFSEVNLSKLGKQKLDYETAYARFKVINDTEYIIEHLDLSQLQSDVFIPFKELTILKKRLLYLLNDSREFIEPINLPVIKKHIPFINVPTLSVLISSPDDVHFCDETSAKIEFMLPNCFADQGAEFIDLFTKHHTLIPWFPAILIGENYHSAVSILKQVQPKRIVTDNTGIAYEANQLGISWIAGPQLNLANSYSLLSLKENLHCAGAYISNEISKSQIQRIKKPENFELHYSIYHPTVLMTSRQCLFHPVIGCEKAEIDDSCLLQCHKTATITNLKKETFVIEKSEGNYHQIFHEHQFLNTEIVSDLSHFFSGFSIDFRNIATETRNRLDKSELIELFENLLKGDSNAENKLHQIICPTSNKSYHKGI